MFGWGVFFAGRIQVVFLCGFAVPLLLDSMRQRAGTLILKPPYRESRPLALQQPVRTSIDRQERREEPVVMLYRLVVLYTIASKCSLIKDLFFLRLLLSFQKGMQGYYSNSANISKVVPGQHGSKRKVLFNGIH